MSMTLVILGAFFILILVMVISHISFLIKQKKYVERKQNDQRKFNPIREKKWWK